MARRASTTTGATTESAVQKTLIQKELERIEKDFGKGSVISSSTLAERVDVISTGSYSLDKATGIGGFPRGKIVELLGWESSGKSTITLQTIANAQKLGLKALLIDGENSFDQRYAKNLGIDVDDMYIEQLDQGGGEKCYNIAERLIKTGELGIVVIDSQTSLLPKKVMEGEIGDSAIGLHARLMSSSVPKIVNAAAIGNTLVIYVSQMREKIGVMFGPAETTNGGNALKFYSHMRVKTFKSVLREKESGDAIANKTTCSIIKNKLARPFQEAHFRVNYGEGVDFKREIFEAAVEANIIVKSGSWYSFDGTNIGQGEENVIDLLKEDEGFFEDVKNRLEGPQVETQPEIQTETENQIEVQTIES